jgi:hypothetical protein
MAHANTRAVWGFLLAFVVVQLAIAAAAIWVTDHVTLTSHTSSAWHAMPIVVALSQGSLLGYWVAFGGRVAELRFLVVTCLVAANAQLLATYSPRVFNVLCFGYAFQPLTTTVLFLGTRFMGFRVERLTLVELPNSNSRQFPLMRLFFWIAVVAAILTILRSTPEIVKLFAFSAKLGRREPDFLVEIVSFAVLALVALWTAFGSRKPILRLAMLASTMVICLAVHRLLGPHMQGVLGRTLLLFVGYPLLLVFWFLGFRMLGYRARSVHRVRRFDGPGAVG